ncbi:hypothetical protein LY78DRAFT_593719, partial [Colletotrichum sublineola]
NLVCRCNDGQIAALYTCTTLRGSKLAFEFRQWPDRRREGSIGPPHKGPCAVYMTKVDGMVNSA